MTYVESHKKKCEKVAHPETRNDVIKTFVFHRSPPKAKNISRLILRRHAISSYSFENHKSYSLKYFALSRTLTFIQTGRYVSSNHTETNEQDNHSSAKSATICRRKETETGEDESNKRHCYDLKSRK